MSSWTVKAQLIQAAEFCHARCKSGLMKRDFHWDLDTWTHRVNTSIPITIMVKCHRCCSYLCDFCNSFQPGMVCGVLSQNVPPQIPEGHFCPHPSPAGQGLSSGCCFKKWSGIKQALIQKDVMPDVQFDQVQQLGKADCSKNVQIQLTLHSCIFMPNLPITSLLIKLLLWNPQEVIDIIKLCWSCYFCKRAEFLQTQNYNQKIGLKMNSSSWSSLYQKSQVFHPQVFHAALSSLAQTYLFILDFPWAIAEPEGYWDLQVPWINRCAHAWAALCSNMQ